MNPKGLNTPAAIGMPTKLYMLAKRKLRRILLTVFRDRSKQPMTSSKSFWIKMENGISISNSIKFE
jgi:hypothetical protein